jgi:hypothetical protein
MPVSPMRLAWIRNRSRRENAPLHTDANPASAMSRSTDRVSEVLNGIRHRQRCEAGAADSAVVVQMQRLQPLEGARVRASRCIALSPMPLKPDRATSRAEVGRAEKQV